jgi:micrococcal nuclease
MGIFRLILRALASPKKSKPIIRANPTYYKKRTTTVVRKTTVRVTRQPDHAGGFRSDLIGKKLTGRCYVIDGDTISIKRTKIRLGGIDAPELNEPWGQKAKWVLVSICKGHEVVAHLTGETSHDRLVASCIREDGVDIAAEIVRQGLALDWKLFSGGKYRQYEPAGARKKLWKIAHR